MKRPPTNIAHSVRVRLLKAAKESGEEFNYALTRYAHERLLARLAASKHADKFVLKGAMLFRVWSSTMHRPTKDLDLLGSGAPDLERVAKILSEVCTTSVEDDGIVFDPKTVRAARIKEDADYEGVRVTMRGTLGTARLDVQIDVGFGDAITPGPIEVDFPTMLAMPPPRIRAYPQETVVAEKLEAMVHLGMANSRMKDFFDLAFLARTFSFDGPTLAKAIAATFERRKTDLPSGLPVGLTSEFYGDDSKQKQWKAFSSRIGAKGASLEDVVKTLAGFLEPVVGGAREPERFAMVWPPLGPWTAKKRA
jgi:predicted nucleotidyltransferase component of viral defense system